MAPRMTNIDMLLMMTEDLKSQGDDLYEEMSERGTAHAGRLQMMLTKIDQARAILLTELERYRKYLPEPNEHVEDRVNKQMKALGRELSDQPGDQPIPRIVTQGPRK